MAVLFGVQEAADESDNLRNLDQLPVGESSAAWTPASVLAEKLQRAVACRANHLRSSKAGAVPLWSRHRPLHDTGNTPGPFAIAFRVTR